MSTDLKTLVTPRPYVFNPDRRAIVLNLDNFLDGKISGEEYFRENYVTQGMKTLLRSEVFPDLPALTVGEVRVIGFHGRNTDVPLGIWGELSRQLGKQDQFKDGVDYLSL